MQRLLAFILLGTVVSTSAEAQDSGDFQDEFLDSYFNIFGIANRPEQMKIACELEEKTRAYRVLADERLMRKAEAILLRMNSYVSDATIGELGGELGTAIGEAKIAAQMEGKAEAACWIYQYIATVEGADGD